MPGEDVALAADHISCQIHRRGLSNGLLISFERINSSLEVSWFAIVSPGRCPTSSKAWLKGKLPRNSDENFLDIFAL